MPIDIPAGELPEIIDGLPNLCGSESRIEAATSRREPVHLGRSPLELERIQSAFSVALHMHQPLVLDDGDIRAARVLGNLEYMMARKEQHDFHDAPAYAHCYARPADLIRELSAAGRRPRLMLDYSGELLFGLRQMGLGQALEGLKAVARDERTKDCVEWLGTMWGHAVAASTPVPDLILHMRAWQHQFASVFGLEALARVRGFSPPEMSLPNHPDVAYAYVGALKASGYDWLLVQEHTVEETDGSELRERHLPRRLVARDGRGREVSITALIKTQGSDTKLVGHMQPYSEAQSLRPRGLAGKTVPPIAVQISDGENGGVMMNEFPGNYKRVFSETGTEGVVGLAGTEYLELLAQAGVGERDFAPVQPKHQHAVWRRLDGRSGPEEVARAIEDAKRADHRFSMDGGSWTNDISWVRGYDNVLDPMRKLSSLFHRTLDGRAKTDERAYRNALFHLLATQSSDYRYWGPGRWTENARELCRRGTEVLERDFGR